MALLRPVGSKLIINNFLIYRYLYTCLQSDIFLPEPVPKRRPEENSKVRILRPIHIILTGSRTTQRDSSV